MYQKYVKRYDLARRALLLMVLLTVANIVWLMFDLDASSVCSAVLPILITRAGVMLYVLDLPLYAVILCGVAVALLLAAYVTCWGLSQKRGGWLLAAMILFGVDLLGMLYMVISSFVIAVAEKLSTDLLVMIVWVVFEFAVMFFLVRGVIAKHKLRKIDMAK